MRAQLRKIGNATGLILPAEMLERLDLHAGDTVKLTEHGTLVVIEPEPLKPRKGGQWAGRVKISNDFDEPCPEIEEMFLGKSSEA